MKRSGLGCLLSFYLRSLCFSSSLCSCFLLCLCLQGSLFALLSFLGFLHLEALLDLFFLFGSVKDILDRACRALGSAQAALDALLGIDLTEIILNGDRTLRADSRALSASDTCNITSFSCICALLLVVTADLDLGRLRDDLDQFLRTSFSAGTAACAVVASYDRYAVDDADRVEFTGPAFLPRSVFAPCPQQIF